MARGRKSKRQRYELMSIERFQEVFNATGLSPEGFARVIKVSHKSVYNWLKKDVKSISPLAQIQIKKQEKRLVKKRKLDVEKESRRK